MDRGLTYVTMQLSRYGIMWWFFGNNVGRNVFSYTQKSQTQWVNILFTKCTIYGHAITQVVSRQLLAVGAWIRSQVSLCGICGRQSETGADILLVLQFPLPILIPPTAHFSRPSSMIDTMPFYSFSAKGLSSTTW